MYINPAYPSAFNSPNDEWRVDVSVGAENVIEEMSQKWTSLCDEGAASVPFLRPEWFTALVRAFEYQVMLVTVWRRTELRAVLPLLRQRDNLHGLPAQKLTGVFNPNSPRFDLIHGTDESEREQIIRSIWKVLRGLSRWDVVEFRLVPEGSWLFDLLILAEKSGHAIGVWPMDDSPVANFPDDCAVNDRAAAFLRCLTRKFVSELKRRRGKLERKGRVTIESEAYTPETLDEYFWLEEQSWKATAGTAVGQNAGTARLHREFASAMASLGLLSVYALRCDKAPVAMALLLKDHNKLFFWKTSFDPQFREFGPGNLLIREFMLDAATNGTTVLDMLSPATDYKKVWCNDELNHFGLYIFNRGVFGRILCFWKFTIAANLRYMRKSR
ncbi:MAG: GNAT family N-acetyltransferase [Pyrinomonadaceae bacterium]|nr:GNAT family N-acetyltransferase [Pyrinomonadaceae bacterium]